MFDQGPRRRRTVVPTEIQALLQWTYVKQKADAAHNTGAGLHDIEASADGVEVRKVSGDGVARIAAIEHLGCRVDSGGRSTGGQVHEVAEMVHEAVRRLSPLAYGFVLYCAKTEQPMDWGGALPPTRPHVVKCCWRKEAGRDGALRGIYRNRNLIGHRIVPVITPQHIRYLRTNYITWWHAMATVVERLAKAGLHVDGPAAPIDPWMVGGVDCQLPAWLGDLTNPDHDAKGLSELGPNYAWTDHRGVRSDGLFLCEVEARRAAEAQRLSAAG